MGSRTLRSPCHPLIGLSDREQHVAAFDERAAVKVRNSIEETKRLFEETFAQGVLLGEGGWGWGRGGGGGAGFGGSEVRGQRAREASEGGKSRVRRGA